MEIITGGERRRRWSLEQKLRILAEIEQPGGSVASVARRHEISRGLLWHWRSRFRKPGGTTPRADGPAFLPVRLAAPPGAGPGAVETNAASIELAFPDGVRLTVCCGVDLELLGQVLSVLRR